MRPIYSASRMTEMGNTHGAKVYRSGESVRKYNYENNDVDIDSAAGKLRIRFKLASKGGGVTDVKVELTSVSFDRICAEMRKLAPDHAARVMARHLHDHLSPEVESA
jgi:hypothetical protein